MLTDEEIAILLETWDIIQENMDKVGTDMFVRWVMFLYCYTVEEVHAILPFRGDQIILTGFYNGGLWENIFSSINE